MVIKEKSGIKTKPWTLSLRLSENERRMIDAISADQGTSVAQAIRTVIQEAHERHQEDRNRTRLEDIEEQVRNSNSSLAQIAARIESLFPVVRSAEIDLKEKFGRMNEGFSSKLNELEGPINATAIRLLAMINSSAIREKVEAETQRIMRES